MGTVIGGDQCSDIRTLVKFIQIDNILTVIAAKS